MLGAISAAIGYAQGDDVYAYEAVCGQQMDHLVMCTKDEARACWTLPEILKSTDDAEFKAYAEDHYFLADEEDTNDGLDDKDDYFSDGSLPMEEREEVDDDYFFTNILEDISNEDLNQNPIGAKGNAYSVGEVSLLDSDADQRGEDSISAFVPSVSDGEDFVAAKGQNMVRHFVPPVPNGKDFLVAVPHCVPVNTPVCDWADFRLVGLSPEPCEKEGANCNRFAHRLCGSQWEEGHDLPEHGIANFGVPPC